MRYKILISALISLIPLLELISPILLLTVWILLLITFAISYSAVIKSRDISVPILFSVTGILSALLTFFQRDSSGFPIIMLIIVGFFLFVLRFILFTNTRVDVINETPLLILGIILMSIFSLIFQTIKEHQNWMFATSILCAVSLVISFFINTIFEFFHKKHINTTLNAVINIGEIIIITGLTVVLSTITSNYYATNTILTLLLGSIVGLSVSILHKNLTLTNKFLLVDYTFLTLPILFSGVCVWCLINL